MFKVSNPAFLVYDSRSGSTILSKVLERQGFKLYVTPEIAFDELLLKQPVQAGKQPLKGGVIPTSSVLRVLKSPGLRNIIDHRATKRSSFGEQQSAEGFIRALLNHHIKNKFGAGPVAETGPQTDDRCILVKNGSHLKYVDHLCLLFGPQTPFIFMHRDPRDVIASKCRTPRPYAPGEVMAWGGVLLAAIRWNRYANLALHAKRQQRRIHFVSYEDFVTSPSVVISAIYSFLHLSMDNTCTTQGYDIPLQEQKIHQSALDGKVVKSKLGSWHGSLSRYQVITLEFVCKNSMRELGYPCAHTAGTMELMLSLAKAAFESTVKIVRTYLLRASFRLTRVNRKV